MCGGARSSAAPARPAAPTSRPWTTRCCGAAARGVTERVAEKVFTQVIAFSEFGFPKSHAAAFGLLAYQSAWLRHYHPAEYYCALFNNQPMGFYSLDALGRDAKRNGIEIRLPDVNVSDVWCTVEGQGNGRLKAGEGGRGAGVVRVGLAFIRDWSEETATAVVAEREQGGPFRSVGDVVRRAPPQLKRPAIEHLVWVGGCDGFGLTRRELLWQVGLWLPPQSDPGDEARRRRPLELPRHQPLPPPRFGGPPAGDRRGAAALGARQAGEGRRDAQPARRRSAGADAARDAGCGKRDAASHHPSRISHPASRFTVRLPEDVPPRRTGVEGLGLS